MKSSELKWSHIRAAMSALERGMSGPEAANEAGIGPRVWRLLRGKRSGPQVLALLAKNDPLGQKVYLSEFDELCRGCLKGRPVTSGLGRRARVTRSNVDRPVAELLGPPVEL